ncbi:hypothetical protein Sjap_022901 [Stephania japonica]|uniref:RING-type E3 ubiquitin transferase n=1 Tax=Stephania japonica TaxID=461633 RepID=A0AAP0EYJ1_9MAGN
MDEDNGRRVVGGCGIVSGRESALAVKDASNCEDRGGHYCKKLSCNTRLKSIKSNQLVCSDRDRPSSSSFRPKSGKAVIGSSSKTYSATTDARKPRGKFHDPPSHKETVSSGLNPEEERVVQEPNASTSMVQLRVLEDENIESVVFNGCSVDSELGNYPAAPNARAQKQKCPRNHVASQGSSTPSFACRTIGQASKVASGHSQCSKATRYGLRNLRCTSISDVISSSSSSNLSHSRIKRGPDGECSSSAREKIASSSSSASSGNQMNSLSAPSISLSERPSFRPASRRTRYWPPNADGVASVRTQRTTNGEAMSSIAECSHGSGLLPPEAPVLIPDLPQTELSIRERSAPGTSQQAAAELPNTHLNSTRRSFSRNDDIHTGPVLYLDEGGGGSFSRFSTSQDGIQRFNVDGITEVLLALERIQHDEELTYEQLLVLEANLFLGGLTLHDQHRDMRLDIDNMSYEELLALGEKMGTVSTALTDEELSKCIKKICFRAAPPEAGSVGHGNEDDVKCSICQEEYADGDEVGKLRCDHRYHVACLYQWLRLKNWCPICKADAATP